MKTDNYPSLPSLRDGLSSLLQRAGVGVLDEIERVPNPRRSTFPTEIVRVRTSSGVLVSLFLKYDPGPDWVGPQPERGVEFEASIYARVLRPLDVGVARFWGAFPVAPRPRSCMVLDELRDALPVNKVPNPGMLLAARWLGHFHRRAERAAMAPDADLRVVGLETMRHWIHRAREFAGPVAGGAWFHSLIQDVEERIAILTRQPFVLVHGEYYASNVLMSGGSVIPVDWHGAALGAGELDLAALLDGWGHGRDVDGCVQEYARARWQRGAPSGFREALRVARLYWPLRWLGARPEWARGRYLGYLDVIRAEAEHQSSRGSNQW